VFIFGMKVLVQRYNFIIAAVFTPFHVAMVLYDTTVGLQYTLGSLANAMPQSEPAGAMITRLAKETPIVKAVRENPW
jgi:hypothetical protein